MSYRIIPQLLSRSGRTRRVIVVELQLVMLVSRDEPNEVYSRASRRHVVAVTARAVHNTAVARINALFSPSTDKSLHLLIF